MRFRADGLLALGLIGAGGAFAARAQCPDSAPPFEPLLRELQVETGRIFKKFGLTETATLPEAARPVESDRLIVPGKRVGSFEVGATFSALSSKIRMSPLKKKLDGRYSLILPLGYIPERFVAEGSVEGLTFAFSPQDGPALEIFVRNPKFVTESGISVGSPVSSLSREGSVKKRVSEEGRTYYQGDGITYVADSKEVLEIVVIRRPTSRP